MPIFPASLNTGDLILAINPSGKVNVANFMKGCELLETKGYHVQVGKFALSEHYKFAGTHSERLHDLQWALNHTEAKAIICGRGGYGVTHLMDHLNWSAFEKNPKWLIGYSDITALHHAIYTRGYCSIHGPVLQNLHKNRVKDFSTLLNLLKGTHLPLKLPSVAKTNYKLSGELVGGNLSMLINQLGTPSEIDYSGTILFIEEVGEYLYHVDRMLLQLKRAGKLSKLLALIVGDFSGMKESKDVFGQNVKEIIAHHCKVYNYPLIFDFPIGHGKRNYPLIHGAEVILENSGEGFSLRYLEVESS